MKHLLRIIFLGRRVGPGSGIAIRCDQRYLTATIGCVLRSGREQYLLTTHHPFVGVRLGAPAYAYRPHADEKERIRGHIGDVCVVSRFRTGPEATPEDHLLIRVRPGAPVSHRFPQPTSRLDTEPIGGELNVGDRVEKHGMQTGHVRGAISGVRQNLVIPCHNGSSAFFARTCLEIRPDAAGEVGTREDPIDFCEEGDSGALVLGHEQSPRAVGLLVGQGSSNHSVYGHGYALPFGRVFRPIGRQLRSAGALHIKR